MTEFQDLRGAAAAVQERGPGAVVGIGSARRLGSRSAGELWCAMWFPGAS